MGSAFMAPELSRVASLETTRQNLARLAMRPYNSSPNITVISALVGNLSPFKHRGTEYGSRSSSEFLSHLSEIQRIEFHKLPWVLCLFGHNTWPVGDGRLWYYSRRMSRELLLAQVHQKLVSHKFIKLCFLYSIWPACFRNTTQVIRLPLMQTHVREPHS